MITTLPFFFQLALSVFVFWSLKTQKNRVMLLVLSSLVFLFITQKTVLFTVIPIAIFSYLVAVLIKKVENKYKKLLLISSTSSLIIILFVFKVPKSVVQALNFLLQNGEKNTSGIVDLLIYPLGLSYLVFKIISYLADVYWDKIEPGKFLNYFSYLSLFTIYTAGPIERYTNYLPQIVRQPDKFSKAYLEFGIYRITVGLFKKLVLANWIGYFLNTQLHFRRSGTFEAIDIIGLCIFSLQIYFDFAGYSDIAIGSSKFFGLTIMENFNSPFFQPNISKFWQSWHISLSSWIRDYIFYPLSLFSFIRRIDFQFSGGLSLLKIWNMTLLPVIAFVICGLWHGVSVGFITWGALHGAAISIYTIWVYNKKKYSLANDGKFSKTYYALGMIITFIFVSISWHFFI